MNERYLSLQILRAVAAWVVVFHHYMQMFYNFKYDSFLGAAFSNYGSFGVDVFFVISGFVMYVSAKNPSIDAYSFMVKRVFRIAPVYWFYSFVMLGFIFLFPVEFSYTDYNFHSFFASLFFYPNLNPSGIGLFPLHTVGWTLNYEMVFYLILAFSILLSKQRAIIICSVLIVLLPYVWPKSFPFSQILTSFSLYLFLGGVLVSAISSSKWFSSLSGYQGLLSLMVLGFGVFCFRYSYLHWSLKLVSAIAIVFSVALMSKYFSANNVLVRFLVKAGDYSYSTYLVHVFVIGLALHLFGNELSQVAEAMVIFLVTLLVYFSSKYSFIFLESNGNLLLLQRYILGKPPKFRR